MSYLGRSAKLSRKTQEKVSFLATAGQTSKTGLSYVPTFVEVSVNGILLTDVTDYTATSGSSVSFGVALELNDEVTVVSLKTFALADHYTKTQTDSAVSAAAAALVDSSPAALNTLNELAAALGDDANYATTTTNAIATKLPLAGGTMTGALIVSDTVTADKVEIGDGAAGGTSEILFSDNSSARGKIIYDHSSNPETMLLQTTGTTALSIDNTQDVSIPNGNLDVTGTVTSDGLVSSGNVTLSKADQRVVTGTSTGRAIISNSSTSAYVALYGANHAQWANHIDIAAAGNVTIISGNVGIGTNSPSALLDVSHSTSTAYNGGAEVTESLLIHNKNGTDNTGVNNFASLGFAVADGATSQGFINYVRTGNNTGALTVSQRTSASNYAEQIRIDSDGLKFNGNTAAANALNDYEEGTWTPTDTVGGGTLNASASYYTKIGNVVNLWTAVTWTGVGSETSTLQMNGLPFTIANGQMGGSVMFDNFTSSTGAYNVSVFLSGTSIKLYQSISNNSWNPMRYITNIGVGDSIYLNATYRTDQ